jgi:precorrin-6B methylase 2
MSVDRTITRPPQPVLTEIDRTRISSLNQILIRAAFARRAEINDEVFRIAGSTVAFGPFKGTKLPAASSWGEGEFTPKVLGCYEEELHPAIEKAIARRPNMIVNIGCAEGYYAIGLARRMPEARVLAFDIDASAQEICRGTAADNGVADRIFVEGACTSARLRALASSNRSLVFMDCEGAELNLLDEATVAALAKCDVIVECHDFVDRTLTATLLRRFAATHAVDTIQEGPRDPGKYMQLRTLNSIDRWLAVCEFRPEHMHWLACWAR